MSKDHIIESDIETYLKDTIKKIGGKAMKFKSPGKRGVPDQIILYKGTTYFMELKKPNEKPRASQKVVHKEFMDNGIPVYTADTKYEVDQFILNVLNTELPAPCIKQIQEPTKIYSNLFKVNCSEQEMR